MSNGGIVIVTLLVLFFVIRQVKIVEIYKKICYIEIKKSTHSKVETPEKV